MAAGGAMDDDECIHGMNPTWCSTCTKAPGDAPRTRIGEYGFHGGASKQDLLHTLCDLLGVPRQPVGRGSSLPSDVFEEAARQAGVPVGSMPEIGERIVTKAGRTWRADYDSRGTVSGGGSTVTFDGLEAMIEALRQLLAE